MNVSAYGRFSTSVCSAHCAAESRRADREVHREQRREEHQLAGEPHDRPDADHVGPGQGVNLALRNGWGRSHAVIIAPDRASAMRRGGQSRVSRGPIGAVRCAWPSRATEPCWRNLDAVPRLHRPVVAAVLAPMATRRRRSPSAGAVHRGPAGQLAGRSAWCSPPALYLYGVHRLRRARRPVAGRAGPSASSVRASARIALGDGQRARTRTTPRCCRCTWSSTWCCRWWRRSSWRSARR